MRRDPGDDAARPGGGTATASATRGDVRVAAMVGVVATTSNHPCVQFA